MSSEDRRRTRSEKVVAYRAEWDKRGIPFGFCLCGCGERTEAWTESEFSRNRIKGEPRWWIRDHDKRLAPFRWTEEDRGHDTPCWVWKWSLNAGGYGQWTGRGLAHRAAYEDHRGPIPAGLHLDHLCRVRECVNPDHLEAVTQRENNRRQSNQKLTLDKARAIRAEFQGWRGRYWTFCRIVGERYGVHAMSIDFVLAGKTWKDD